jgi:hypothetical protein
MTYEDEPGKARSSEPRKSSWLTALFAVLGLPAILAIVIFWIEDPRLTLDYVRALAWPVLVATCVFWVRHTLRQKMRDLLELDVAGARAQFANNTMELQAQIEDATAMILNPDEISGEDDESAEKPAEPEGKKVFPTGVPKQSTVGVPEVVHTDGAAQSGGELSGSKPLDSEQMDAIVEKELARRAPKSARRREIEQRRAIEEIIRDSAGWGYDMAKLGFKSRPVPKIDWTEDGRPRILYGKGEQPRASQPEFSVNAKVRNLEKAIIELERQLKGPPAHTHSWETALRNKRADQERLQEMKLRRRSLNPNSAYVD